MPRATGEIGKYFKEGDVKAERTHLTDRRGARELPRGGHAPPRHYLLGHLLLVKMDFCPKLGCRTRDRHSAFYPGNKNKLEELHRHIF